jgi:hypothetical protein
MNPPLLASNWLAFYVGLDADHRAGRYRSGRTLRRGWAGGEPSGGTHIRLRGSAIDTEIPIDDVYHKITNL